MEITREQWDLMQDELRELRRCVFGSQYQDGLVKKVARIERVIEWFRGSIRILAFIGPFTGAGVALAIYWWGP